MLVQGPVTTHGTPGRKPVQTHDASLKPQGHMQQHNIAELWNLRIVSQFVIPWADLVRGMTSALAQNKTQFPTCSTCGTIANAQQQVWLVPWHVWV